VRERSTESPLWQFFSGRHSYEHRPPSDATQDGRWRQYLGEDGMEQLRIATMVTADAKAAGKPEAAKRVKVGNRMFDGEPIIGPSMKDSGCWQPRCGGAGHPPPLSVDPSGFATATFVAAGS
jgi:hypothetical protein